MIKKILKIDGMHCTSCSMNIDGELEDMEGVGEANTSYARQETEVTFDNAKISLRVIIETIERLGYKVKGK